MPNIPEYGRREPLVPGRFDAKFLVSMEPAQRDQIEKTAGEIGISRNEFVRRALYSYMEKLDSVGDF